MSAPLDENVDTFRHEAFLYRDEWGFASGVARFVRDGLAEDQTVAVAAPVRHLRLLRNSLGGRDASKVVFINMEVLGRNPGRIIDRWQQLVDAHATSGRGLRGVGEPAWPGRREAEYQECQLHEYLLNEAFAGGPAWRLMCPYDAIDLPRSVVHGATRTHPLCGDGAHDPHVRASQEYLHAGWREAFAAPLPAPPADAVARHYHAARDIAGVRASVAAFAQAAGLGDEKVADLCLASSELATNSLRYGTGFGLLTMWREPEAVVVQISDGGHITDPLVGRRAPRPEGAGGRGLYLTHQLCDLVQLRSSAGGTVARLRTWI